MKLTEEQIVDINMAGMGCSIIKTGVTPDAADDKTLPTNAYLLELKKGEDTWFDLVMGCLLYTSPSPRDVEESRMPSSA